MRELRLKDRRHLPLAQVFELAAEAEATLQAAANPFPRTTERLRGEFKTRQTPTRFDTGAHSFQQAMPQTATQHWPPPVRYSLPNYSTERERPMMRSSPVRKETPHKNVDERAEWARKRPCWVCGKTGHLIKDCPKKKASGCLRCGQNHMIRECPQRGKATIGVVAREQEGEEAAAHNNDRREEEDELFEQALAVKKQNDKTVLQFEVQINGSPITAVIDTGAQLSLMALEEAERVGLTWQPVTTGRSVTGVGGDVLDVRGVAEVVMKRMGRKKTSQVHIAKGVTKQLILGLPWIRRHAPVIHWDDLSMTFKDGEVWSPDPTNAVSPPTAVFRLKTKRGGPPTRLGRPSPRRHQEDGEA